MWCNNIFQSICRGNLIFFVLDRILRAVIRNVVRVEKFCDDDLGKGNMANY